MGVRSEGIEQLGNWQGIMQQNGERETTYLVMELRNEFKESPLLRKFARHVVRLGVRARSLRDGVDGLVVSVDPAELDLRILARISDGFT